MSASSGLSGLLHQSDAYSIQQAKEWTEILVGFDVANRYLLLDGDGAMQAEVLEEGSGLLHMLTRNFLGVWRSMKLHVRDEGRNLATIVKPFSFFFHRMDVTEGREHIGHIQRRFSLLGRKYSIHDAGGRQIGTIHRPFWSLWKYPAYDANGRPAGRITKRWGGFLKELFSDADTYGVRFEPGCEEPMRTLLFSAMFLVDLTNTEDNAGSEGLL